ncbi:MAG: hypothetical protein V2A58_10655 [Planctomycetota bacterium]
MRVVYVVLTILFPGLGHLVKGEHLKGVVLGICFALPFSGFLVSWAVYTEAFHPAFEIVCLCLFAAVWIVAIIDIARRVYFVDESATLKEKERLFREGVEAYLRGDFNRAEEALHALLRVDHDDPDGYFHLAMVFKEKGDLERARKALRRCRSVDDADKWAWEVQREEALLGAP